MPPSGASRSASACAGRTCLWRSPPSPRSCAGPPVEGATAYDVWYPEDYINKVVRTHTNVADQRDLYTFHLEDSWWRTVRWRVRAVRQVVGSIPNGLPAVSYGPWTSVYATTSPGWSSGPLNVFKGSVGTPAMTWSAPIAVRVARPTFRISG